MRYVQGYRHHGARQPVRIPPPSGCSSCCTLVWRPQTEKRTSTGREQEVLRSLETSSAAKDAQRVWGEKEIPRPIFYTYTFRFGSDIQGDVEIPTVLESDST